MTNGTHEAAVQLLTDHQRFVRLVVQREIKGPLEPPQSPHSPSYLKGLSPSGYMANRPGYKRTSVGSVSNFVESPTTETHMQLDNSKYIITNSSPSVPQQKGYQDPTTPTSGSVKTNGIGQPVPAPRRLTSQSSINGQSGPQNGNRSEDDDVQVKFLYHKPFMTFILIFSMMILRIHAVEIAFSANSNFSQDSIYSM